MATLVLTCSAPDCDMGLRVPIKTPNMPSGDALEVLKMHREDCHPTAVAAAVRGPWGRDQEPHRAGDMIMLMMGSALGCPELRSAFD